VRSGPPGGGTWTGVAITAAGIVAGLIIAFAISPLRSAILDAVSGDTAVVVWYPAEILDAAAGFVYGFGPALPLVMGSWVLSGVLAYWVGRHLARPVLYRFVGKQRFQRLEGLLERGGVTFLLAARLVPIVPFSLLGYVCGAARVPLPRYIWTTAVGYLPITAYFIYLGSQLEGFSLEDPIVWIGAGGLLLALFGVRHLLPSAHPEREPPPPEPASGKPAGRQRAGS